MRNFINAPIVSGSIGKARTMKNMLQRLTDLDYPGFKRLTQK